MLLAGRIFRLSRAQFLPVMLSPILVGTAPSSWSDKALNALTFSLVVLGSVTGHLLTSIIDDSYDCANGFDTISNEMFPPDFGEWKILPSGLMTFDQVKFIAYSFFS
jgi:1,4-dihydroxy-2-naphthoate octaprenyltransferase